MRNNIYLTFADKTISYEDMIEDLSARIMKKLNEINKVQGYISQRKAFRIFGRANVERWKRQGRIKPCKRPGKMEYCMADLYILKAESDED